MTDDLIRRQEAITLPVMPKEHREYQTLNLDDAYEQGWNDLQKCIEALTSAQPERKTGKWVKMSDADGIYWACNECGEDIPRISHYNPQFDLFPRLESIGRTNYCPNCGAYMR